MPTYLEEWIDLVDRIVETDILEPFDQKEMISSIIKNPLPLDRTAGRDFQFMEQLEQTSEETKTDVVCCTVTVSESCGIYCANAATGMGKTHLVYLLGETRYMVIIRAMEQGTDHISEPWNLLSREIQQQLPRNGKEEHRDKEVVVETATKMIYLLLLCYLDLSLIVIDFYLLLLLLLRIICKTEKTSSTQGPQ
jgi:hypothetical protein